MRLLGICGSLQAESSNLTLLRSAASLAPTLQPTAATLELYDGLRHVPPFDPDVEAAGFPPEIVDLKARLSGSAGVVIACPEYVFAVPGTVKNMLDWLVGSMDIDRKPILVTASVSHPARGGKALESLTRTLEVMGAVIVGSGVIVRGPDEIDDLRRRLTDLVAAAR